MKSQLLWWCGYVSFGVVLFSGMIFWDLDSERFYILPCTFDILDDISMHRHCMYIHLVLLRQIHGRVSLTPDARDCLQLARTLFLEYFTTRLRMMDKNKCTALRLTIVPSSIVLEIDVIWRNGRFYTVLPLPGTCNQTSLAPCIYVFKYVPNGFGLFARIRT